ncbi:hypothetical protein EYF80_045566 [Liparis tanakae]|uniref:Uncharacterized protein n=1 Tax=Liparis tanakae TaxID=230148 RepID=A0A4Z2FSU8_9TELE|nr:hypothetical protein EYF80_045566 [Liparis tanakae]
MLPAVMSMCSSSGGGVLNICCRSSRAAVTTLWSQCCVYSCSGVGCTSASFRVTPKLPLRLVVLTCCCSSGISISTLISPSLAKCPKAAMTLGIAAARVSWTDSSCRLVIRETHGNRLTRHSSATIRTSDSLSSLQSRNISIAMPSSF